MKWVLVFLFVLLLVLAGCRPAAQPSAGRGVKLEFVEYPEGELVETSRGPEPFGLGLQVSNFANVPIQGQLCVSNTIFGHGGIPENECKAVDVQPAFRTSDGKVTENVQTFEFGPFSYTEIDKEYTTEIAADLRYSARSRHFVKMCVVQDEKRPGLPGECKDKATLAVTQDQLPLVVKNVRKDVNPLAGEEVLVKLAFDLVLEERGQIIPLSDVTQLRSAPGLVQVAVRGYGQEFECSPLTQDRLYHFRPGGTNEVRCTAFITLGQPRLDDVVEVNLGYGVSDTVNIPPVKLIKQQEQRGVA